MLLCTKGNSSTICSSSNLGTTKYPSTREWTKLQYIHTMVYCSAIEVDELLMHTIMIWVNLHTLDCTKKGRHKTEHCIITVIWNSRADMVVWEEWAGNGEKTTFCGLENSLGLCGDYRI